MKKGFMGSDYVPKRGSEESKAISKLKGMKVYEVMTDDACFYSDFNDVWYAVAHETDMYEVYDTQAAYDKWLGGTRGLTYASYMSAIRWMQETRHLVTE